LPKKAIANFVLVPLVETNNKKLNNNYKKLVGGRFAEMINRKVLANEMRRLLEEIEEISDNILKLRNRVDQYIDVIEEKKV
jgi:hypothetical protein